MTKKFVTYNGTTQEYTIVEDITDVAEAVKAKRKVLVNELLAMSEKEETRWNPHQRIIALTSQINKCTMLEACAKLAEEFSKGLTLGLKDGSRVIINKLGGFTPWNEEKMKFAEETVTAQ